MPPYTIVDQPSLHSWSRHSLAIRWYCTDILVRNIQTFTFTFKFFALGHRPTSTLLPVPLWVKSLKPRTASRKSSAHTSCTWRRPWSAKSSAVSAAGAVISTDYEIHIANKCSLSLKHVRAHLKSLSPREQVARAAAVKAAGKERLKQRKHAAYHARKRQNPSKNLAKQEESQQRLAWSDKNPELKRNVEWRQQDPEGLERASGSLPSPPRRARSLAQPERSHGPGPLALIRRSMLMQVCVRPRRRHGPHYQQLYTGLTPLPCHSGLSMQDSPRRQKAMCSQPQLTQLQPPPPWQRPSWLRAPQPSLSVQ